MSKTENKTVNQADTAVSGNETKWSAPELLDTLTGFERLAIRQAFGKSWSELDSEQLMEALAFVLQKRDGKSDLAAKNAVQQLTWGELSGLFADDEDPDAGEGETPAA